MLENSDNTNNQPFKWLHSNDVREMLGISNSTLQTMRIKGTIPSYKLGSTWYYREDEIVATLLASRVTTKFVAND